MTIDDDFLILELFADDVSPYGMVAVRGKAYCWGTGRQWVRSVPNDIRWTAPLIAGADGSVDGGWVQLVEERDVLTRLVREVVRPRRA